MTRASNAARSANLLGAVALTATDRLVRAATAASGRPTTDTAALVSLLTTLDGESQETLRHTLGLGQSGAVRLIDRLVRGGLVTRRAGHDDRTHAVTLTAAGAEAARAALASRASALDKLLEPLDDHERAALDGVLEKVLGGLATDLLGAYRTCRLCDPDACGHAQGTCPVTEATVTDSAAGAA